jgi:hypothetical protein
MYAAVISTEHGGGCGGQVFCGYLPEVCFSAGYSLHSLVMSMLMGVVEDFETCRLQCLCDLTDGWSLAGCIWCVWAGQMLGTFVRRASSIGVMD